MAFKELTDPDEHLYALYYWYFLVGPRIKQAPRHLVPTLERRLQIKQLVQEYAKRLEKVS